MKTLEVFDPAMCCSTGVCGVDVDPVLAQFSADLQWLAGQGVSRQSSQPRPGTGRLRQQSRRAQGTGSRPASAADPGRRRPDRRPPGSIRRAPNWPRNSGWPRLRTRRRPRRNPAVRPSPAAVDGAAHGNDPPPVLHRQGRRRQNLAVVRHGPGAGRCRQARADRQHRPGIQPRRSAGRAPGRGAHRHSRSGESVCAQHRPRRLGRRVPRAHGRALSRHPAGRGDRQHGRAVLRRLHGRDRRLRRVLQTARRPGGDHRVRSRHLRHRADRPHPAAPDPALGLERLHRFVHRRRVLPRSARRSGKAEGALRRHRGPSGRPGADHGGAGQSRRSRGAARGGADPRRAGRPGREQSAIGDQWPVQRRGSRRRRGRRHDPARRRSAGGHARRPGGAARQCHPLRAARYRRTGRPAWLGGACTGSGSCRIVGRHR